MRSVFRRDKVAGIDPRCFIDSHLCQRLLQEGYEVACLDNVDTYYDPAIKWKNLEAIGASEGAWGFQLKEGDIRDKGLLNDLFRRSTLDLIIHLAAKAGVRPAIALCLAVYLDS